MNTDGNFPLLANPGAEPNPSCLRAEKSPNSQRGKVQSFVSEFASCGGPSPWWFLVHFPATEKADSLLREELRLNGFSLSF